MSRALVLVVAASLWVSAPASAEVPPNFEETYPVEGSQDVPTNAQLWAYGESLRYAGVTAVLRGKASGQEVPVRVESVPVGDLSRIDVRRDEDPGAVGASGIRDLYIARPEQALAPGTEYTLEFSAGALASRSLSFTTAAEADVKAPEPVRAGGVRHEEGGLTDGRKRPYTLFNVWTTDSRVKAPLRVEVLSGKTVEAAELRSIVFVPPKTFFRDGVIEGFVEDCLYFRSVDTAGNVSPVSACVEPQDLRRSRWTAFSDKSVGYEITYPAHFIIDARTGGMVGGSPSVSWSDPDRPQLMGRGRDYHHKGLDPSLAIYTIPMTDPRAPEVKTIEDFVAREKANGYLVDERRIGDRYEGVCPKTEVDGMSAYVLIVPDGSGRLHIIKARLDEAGVVSLERGLELVDAQQKRAIGSFKLLTKE
ncbi:MAG: hypothetical protein MOGMAGMI_01638 [Candidatus Omnitrophica bacterium]|nr:hypothetical protein [Candidatus Omnitrophota bacterium]